MDEGALVPTSSQALGEASALALFLLAVLIMLWPLTKRLVEARRQRVHELRIAAGLPGDDRK